MLFFFFFFWWKFLHGLKNPLSMVPKHTIGTSVWVKDGLINSCGLKNARNCQSLETTEKVYRILTHAHIAPCCELFLLVLQMQDKGAGYVFR